MFSATFPGITEACGHLAVRITNSPLPSVLRPEERNQEWVPRTGVLSAQQQLDGNSEQIIQNDPAILQS